MSEKEKIAELENRVARLELEVTALKNKDVFYQPLTAALHIQSYPANDSGDIVK